MTLIGPTDTYAALDGALSGYTYHFFSDVDDVSVSSHFVRQDVQLENSLVAAIQINHETVIVPAIDASIGSEEAADAITTASRPISDLTDAFSDFVKVRNEIQGSMAYRGAEVGYYLSDENDYFAQMVWTNYGRDFMGENFNLSGGLNYAWDRIEPVNDIRTQGTPGSRNTLYMSLVATQVLTPTTVLRVGLERSLVDGLQHNPYRNVYAGGGNEAEVHPLRRGRNDVFVRISQFIRNGSSVKVDYRYYSDDWHVDSHTLGTRLTQYITDDFVVRYRYRYYRQSGAWFFRDEYESSSGIDGYLTGDYRLGEFDAHLFGGKIFWNLDHFFESYDFIQRVDLTLGYERYFNSTNFTANIFETGLEMSF
jgi:hypothetical protein